MSTSNSNTSGGIGLAGLILAAFIVLKLAGVTQVATWSWFWVLSPLWLGIAIPLAVLAIFFVSGFLVYVAKRQR